MAPKTTEANCYDSKAPKNKCIAFREFASLNEAAQAQLRAWGLRTHSDQSDC